MVPSLTGLETEDRIMRATQGIDYGMGQTNVDKCAVDKLRESIRAYGKLYTRESV